MSRQKCRAVSANGPTVMAHDAPLSHLLFASGRHRGSRGRQRPLKRGGWRPPFGLASFGGIHAAP